MESLGQMGVKKTNKQSEKMIRESDMHLWKQLSGQIHSDGA